MSDIWEPWQPEIGQRVRVRLSAECEVFPHLGESGVAGTVVTVLEDFTQSDGHRFIVRYDAPLPFICAMGTPSELHDSMYAAIELEPVQ